MDIQLYPDLEAKLAILAEQQGRDRAGLVVEAIERFVDYDAWFLAEVDKGLAEVKRLMRIRWTKAASQDLKQIADYLLARTPQHAPRVVTSILSSAASLARSPLRGRPGKKPRTRELVLAPLPCIVIYKTGAETIHIVRILHGAQRWP
jgi:toxin ParE1/3/4